MSSTIKLKGHTLWLIWALFIISWPCLSSAQEEEAELTKYPEIIQSAEATYPPVALKERITAQVELEIEISVTGTVSDALVINTTTIAETLSATVAEAFDIVRSPPSTEYGFDEAAINAVKAMSFSPAEAGGEAISVRVGFTYNFELPPLPSAPPTPPPTAASKLSLQGRVRERGTRTLLPGVIITVFRGLGESRSEAFEAVSDENGQFAFFDLKPGTWRIQGEVNGYYPLRDAIDITQGEITDVTYYLEKGTYSPYDVFVQADRVQREVNRRTLSREEIRTVAGTLGDPILVVENLPGVARPAAGTGDIIVRGSGTADTRVYVDGIQVPIIYHFGGLKSVLPVDMVESVDFYPGNFSVFYGRGTGGVFDAHVRQLNPDQVHGTVELSLLDVSLFAETPVGDKLSVAVSGRRSVIGEVIEGVVPDDADVGVIAAPVYYDGQFIIDWQPSPAHKLQLFAFGSDDTLELLFQNPSDLNPQLTDDNASSSVNFQRVNLQYNFTPQENFQNQALVAVGRDFVDFAFFGFNFQLESLSLQLRDTARFKFSEALSLRAGIDIISSTTDVRARLPGTAAQEGQTGSSTELDEIIANLEDELITEAGAFLELEWSPSQWLQFVPGVRLDYFSLIKQWSADPRIVARLKVADQLTFKGGVGLVYQPPQPVEALAPFGNPNIGLQRALQYSAGVEFGLPKLSNISFDVTFFYKDLGDLITASDQRDEDGEPLFTANTAIGRVYGLETFIEHKFAHNFRGWLSYTLSRSERRDRPSEPWRLFDFDQTHIINLNTSYTLPQGWELGLRLRVVSGNPVTPSIPFNTGQTYFLSDLDTYANVPGESNSDRLPFFSQVDFRIEKSWTFNAFRLKGFLSLINTFNNENVEGFSFNYNFTQRDTVRSLPVFPNLGLRAEF